MLQVVEKLGMLNYFTPMIRLLLQDATAYVNNYNQLIKLFELHRGVCQG